jgi:hypothetical protein
VATSWLLVQLKAPRIPLLISVVFPFAFFVDQDVQWGEVLWVLIIRQNKDGILSFAVKLNGA